MQTTHERLENCPVCGRLMDHSGTRYYIALNNGIERKEVCPICYVRIEQNQMVRVKRNTDKPTSV